jgi:hypothetical protein
MKESREDGMSEQNEPHDQWLRMWQESAPEAPNPERLARMAMARVWHFDHRVFWRNFREYAGGLVMLVICAGQVMLRKDPGGGWVGLGSVGFVMAYLWWRHRGLQPLDPLADLAVYRAAMLRRYDDQIRLLGSVPYWYLLPLFVPPIWVAIHAWHRSPRGAAILLAVVAVFYGFVGWLNVKLAVGVLRREREKIEAMFQEAAE